MSIAARLLLTSASVLLLFSTGCASLAFKPAVQSTGEYRNTAALTEKAEDMPADDAKNVKVFMNELPDGMGIKEGAFVYDREHYELLGKVTADYKDPSLANLGFWVYGYKESERWRTGLCAWQVPLSWVTLTLWSWLSPTYYPCRVSAGEAEERREEIVETLRRAAKAAGADFVIVSGIGGVNVITVSGGTVVGANSISDLSAQGYAFRVKSAGGPRPEPTVVPGASSL